VAAVLVWADEVYARHHSFDGLTGLDGSEVRADGFALRSIEELERVSFAFGDDRLPVLLVVRDRDDGLGAIRRGR